jgi:hypothetical protein
LKFPFGFGVSLCVCGLRLSLFNNIICIHVCRFRKNKIRTKLKGKPKSSGNGWRSFSLVADDYVQVGCAYIRKDWFCFFFFLFDDKKKKVGG